MAKKEKTYKEQTQERYRKKRDAIMSELPEFCRRYFLAREARLSEVTAYVYAHNYRLFFNEYLANNNAYFKARVMLDSSTPPHVVSNDMTIEDLAKITTEDIDEYTHWLLNTNSHSSIENHASSLSSLWKFYIKRGFLEKNPVSGIDGPHKKKEYIVRLEGDERPSFMATVESGDGLTKKQMDFYEKNRERDIAISQLLLSTGIRVSELVGLNLSDLNLDDHSIDIYRKGSKYQRVYMSDECESKIKKYLSLRNILYKPQKSETALFLSNRGMRISVRTVETMIKKYAKISLPRKKDNITPHKLRATFATDALRKTHDLELVSELMGHESIQTTRIYADYDSERHKDVRNGLV